MFVLIQACTTDFTRVPIPFRCSETSKVEDICERVSSFLAYPPHRILPYETDVEAQRSFRIGREAFVLQVMKAWKGRKMVFECAPDTVNIAIRDSFHPMSEKEIDDLSFAAAIGNAEKMKTIVHSVPTGFSCIEPNVFDKSGRFMLSLAVESRSLDAIAFALSLTGIKIDTEDSRNSSPLMLAVEIDSPDIVRMLLNGKANPDFKTNNGDSALSIAVRYNRLDLMCLLLEEKADPNIIDSNGSALLVKACKDNSHEKAAILLAFGASLQPFRSIELPIIAASVSSTISVLDWLFEQGASLDVQHRNATPLVAAIRSGHVVAISRLLQLGADPNLVESLDSTTPPFVLAVKLRHFAVAELLFVFGARLDHPSIIDDSLPQFCEQVGEEQFATFLREMREPFRVDTLRVKGAADWREEIRSGQIPRRMLLDQPTGVVSPPPPAAFDERQMRGMPSVVYHSGNRETVLVYRTTVLMQRKICDAIVDRWNSERSSLLAKEEMIHASKEKTRADETRRQWEASLFLSARESMDRRKKMLEESLITPEEELAKREREAEDRRRHILGMIEMETRETTRERKELQEIATAREKLAEQIPEIEDLLKSQEEWQVNQQMDLVRIERHKWRVRRELDGWTSSHDNDPTAPDSDEIPPEFIPENAERPLRMSSEEMEAFYLAFHRQRLQEEDNAKGVGAVSAVIETVVNERHEQALLHTGRRMELAKEAGRAEAYRDARLIAAGSVIESATARMRADRIRLESEKNAEDALNAENAKLEELMATVVDRRRRKLMLDAFQFWFGLVGSSSWSLYANTVARRMFLRKMWCRFMTPTYLVKSHRIRHAPLQTLFSSSDIVDHLLQIEWSPMHEKRASRPPLPLQGHCLEGSPKTGHIIMFGGQIFDPIDQQMKLTNQLWIKRPFESSSDNNNDWQPVNILVGPSPSARQEATLCLTVDGALYLFGGTTAAGQHSSELWRLDRRGDEYVSWERVEVSPAPTPRQGARMVCYRSFLVLFGGRGSGSNFEERILDDVWVMNLGVRRPSNQWRRIAPIGPQPPARAFHSMAVRSDERLIVIVGGLGHNGTLLGDAWGLYLDEKDDWRWTEPVSTRDSPSDVVPAGRCGHAVAFDRHLLTVGPGREMIGEYTSAVLCTRTWRWIAHPSGRAGQGCFNFASSLPISPVYCSFGKYLVGVGGGGRGQVAIVGAATGLDDDWSSWGLSSALRQKLEKGWEMWEKEEGKRKPYDVSEELENRWNFSNSSNINISNNNNNSSFNGFTSPSLRESRSSKSSISNHSWRENTANSSNNDVSSMSFSPGVVAFLRAKEVAEAKRLEAERDEAWSRFRSAIASPVKMYNNNW